MGEVLLDGQLAWGTDLSVHSTERTSRQQRAAMNERQAFLEAILTDPADDTARLVWADWLDETGDENDQLLAERIRTQIEFADQRVELPWKHPTIKGITGTIRRGLVESIHLTAELFVGSTHLFREHPITVVHLTDKEPWVVNEYKMWSWMFSPTVGPSPDDLALPSSFQAPMLVHPLRTALRPILSFTYPTLARLAASEVAVNLARAEHGLPLLPLTSVRTNSQPT